MFPSIDIVSRERLKQDIKSIGIDPTPKQSLDIASRRKGLVARLLQHQEQGAQYLPIALVEKAIIVPSSAVGKPELIPTMLPSRLPGAASPMSIFAEIAEVERILRRVTCLKALQSVRSVTIQKAHILKGKKKHVRGIRGTTRAETILQRYVSCLKHARWEYDSSRLQLIAMKLTAEDARTFKPLTDKDLQGLTVALEGKDRLGDGYTQMPWYWRIQMSQDTNDEHQVPTSGKAVRAEYEESEFNHPLNFGLTKIRYTRRMVSGPRAESPMARRGTMAPAGSCNRCA